LHLLLPLQISGFLSKFKITMKQNLTYTAEPPALTVVGSDKPSIRAALRSYVPPAPVAAGEE